MFAYDAYAVDVTGQGAVDITFTGSLFSVGNTTLQIETWCSSTTCIIDYSIDDWFVDALDIYDYFPSNQDLWFSSPYQITHQWSEIIVFSHCL